MSDRDLILVCALVLGAYLVAVLIRMARERARRGAWTMRIDSKVENLQHEVALLRDECAQKHMGMNARVSVLERKVEQQEAPDPFETIFNEEE